MQATAQATPPPAHVQLYLTATDKNDVPAVPTPTDLSIIIDRQRIYETSMGPANKETLNFVLMVDLGHPDPDTIESVKRAAAQLYQGLAGGKNQSFLVAFNRSILIRQLIEPGDVQREIDDIHFDGSSALYDTVEHTSAQLLSRGLNPDVPRRVLIVITDGIDTQSFHTADKAIEAAQTEGVAIFALASKDITYKGKGFIRDASRKTGGQAFIYDRLEDGVQNLLAAIQSQWKLTLQTDLPADQKLHPLTIKNANRETNIIAPSQVALQ